MQSIARICSFVIVGIMVFPCHYVCAKEEALKKVSFIPMWSPQAQFAGYYVALEKGIYQEYGLEVNILAHPANEYLGVAK